MLWIACVIPRRYLAPFHQPLPPTARQHAAETAAQAAGRIAQWALQFTPCVTIIGQAHAVLMEVQASLRLWGGQARLMQRIQQGSTQLGWIGLDALSIACGSTARAALWRALAQQEGAWINPHENNAHKTGADGIDADCLDGLPLTVIEELRPHLHTLERMGIHHIGQFRRLPRQGITRRFGQSMLDVLDEAAGRRHRAHAWTTQPDVFRVQRELPARAEHAPPIEQAALMLFHELAAWLLAQQAGVLSIDLHLLHDDPPHSLMQLGFASPTRSAQRFARILGERLIRFQLPRPVYGLMLMAQQAVVLPHRTDDFLGNPQDNEEALHELIERLQARLGADHVQRLRILDEHRPEQATQLIAVNAPPSASGPNDWRGAGMADPPPIGHTSHRPAWLLNQPLPLTVQHHRPVYHGRLQLLAGPERIEAGWWDNHPEGMVQRDYFIARSPQESLLWIFRTPAHAWYLHGFFS
ncbi:MAG: DNA polymerase Y family protein [Burkholderiaceae bacterium]|nr:DNA polymerase Y family protein [Burkholderiaceae bacterium]